MHKQRIQHLLQLYAANQASREEVEELFAWLKEQEGDDALRKFILDSADKEAHNTTLHQSDWDRIWQSVESATTAKAPAKIVRPFWSRALRGIAAAVLFLMMAGSAWFYFSRPKQNSTAVVTAVTPKKDISPGGNKALLTLGDGTTIVLDNAANGQLAQQGKTTVIKSGDGKLVYDAKSLTIDHSPPDSYRETYNLLSTPHGGQFQLVLADGTKVWLNAGSSLYFPATFSASERMVQLTGEAYFEVKPLTPKGGQKKMPFVVKIVTAKGDGGEVRVLGTHFNVNAYSNEPVVKTTLFEGRVKIVKRETANGNLEPAKGKEFAVVLKPGEQAVIASHSPLTTHHSPLTIDHSPDIQKAIAWKNGYFRFKETGIREVMRQVERWYNVEVEYRTDGTGQYYTGVVSRSQNISAILQTLELTGTVHFQIDNKPAKGKQGKIIVLP